MIKNKEEFKNIQIVCRNIKQVEDCLNYLKELGYKTKINNINDYLIIIINLKNCFININCICDLPVEFYNKEIVKTFQKLIEKEKEKKLEDFEVASDGRITKVNNWESEKIVYGIPDYSYELCGFSENDKKLINLGLLYATEETRDKAQFKLEIETKLKNIAERLNGRDKMDWENEEQMKYCVAYDFMNNSLRCGGCYNWKEINCIYSLSENFLDVATKEISKENLIKYFKD